MPEMDSPNFAARANRLYWSSERSAAAIAEELGISRSKLYALIEPLPVDRTCTTCGGTMAFSNRTDRQAGRARCTDCGATITGVPTDAGAAPGPPEPDLDAGLAEEMLAEPNGVAAGLLVGAACGLAVGLIAGTWIRRR